jgi:hypothetical protein
LFFAPTGASGRPDPDSQASEAPASILEGSAMKGDGLTARNLAGAGGRFLGHTAAVVLGLVLMVSGVGMGVTIVLLPLGIPIGLIGLGLFLWGFFGKARTDGNAAERKLGS